MLSELSWLVFCGSVYYTFTAASKSLVEVVIVIAKNCLAGIYNAAACPVNAVFRSLDLLVNRPPSIRVNLGQPGNVLKSYRSDNWWGHFLFSLVDILTFFKEREGRFELLNYGEQMSI